MIIVNCSAVAPCLPGSVVADLDCRNNRMTVNWNKTSNSDRYTAWAIGKNKLSLSCNTTSNNCSIHELQCGAVYEVAVTSTSTNCEALAGSDYKVQSGEWSLVCIPTSEETLVKVELLPPSCSPL